VDQTELRQYLDRFISTLDPKNEAMLNARLQSLVSVFPFNEYEYILMFLLDKGIIRFGEYEKLRESFVSSNKYLELYGLAPRIFGQVWGEQHIMDIDDRFKNADKSLDPNYEGQYDLWIEGARIEVKAARAINTKKRGNLVSKALRYDSPEPFWMNFQQLKLEVCDAFVFIGVWVDQIVYWALSNEDVKSSEYLSHQHRGGIEYQIGVTDKNISAFDVFRTDAQDIAKKVISIGKT